MPALMFSTSTRTLALVQPRFTACTESDAHNVFLDQCVTYVPAEAGVHTRKPSKAFTK